MIDSAHTPAQEVPLATSPTPDLNDLNPFDPNLLRDPWDYYRRLSEEAPVHRDPNTGIFLISSFALVNEAIKDWETFSNRFGRVMGGSGSMPPELTEVMKEGYPPVDTMLTADPPEQKRFRKLIAKAFSVGRVEKLHDKIQAIADELIEGFPDDGAIDFVPAFAQPLSLTVIADQLGVPRAELPLFRTWTDSFVAQLGQMSDLETQIESAKMIVDFQKYFAARLEERRADPQDDIISDIVHAQVEDERPLNVSECLSILQQLLVAGNETTAATLAEGIWLLIHHPGQLELVQNDLSLVPSLVEEVLRLTTPTANMWRVTNRDVELGGVTIPKDSMCLLRYAGANRDPKIFSEPDRFNIRRENVGDHIAFGAGIHFCVGAALARKELNIGFHTLLSRFENFRMQPGAPEPEHQPNILLWGFHSLPIQLSPRAL